MFQTNTKIYGTKHYICSECHQNSHIIKQTLQNTIYSDTYSFIKRQLFCSYILIGKHPITIAKEICLYFDDPFLVSINIFLRHTFSVKFILAHLSLIGCPTEDLERNQYQSSRRILTYKALHFYILLSHVPLKNLLCMSYLNICMHIAY